MAVKTSRAASKASKSGIERKGEGRAVVAGRTASGKARPAPKARTHVSPTRGERQRSEVSRPTETKPEVPAGTPATAPSPASEPQPTLPTPIASFTL
jgi:hypothetical protein